MNQLTNARTFVEGLPRRAQFVILGIVAVTFVVLFLVVRAATATDWVSVRSGVSPEDTGQITAALEEANIAYEISAQGSSVQVAKEQVSEARVAMAEAGVLGGSSRHDDYAKLLDGQKSFGQTSDQAKLQRQRLLEGLIATDIEKIQGVESADVRIVMAEKGVFSEEDSKATSAVTVDTGGMGLEAAQARAIRQLTASAVQDLESSNVSIIDETGKLYEGAEATGAGAGGDGEMTYTAPEMQLEVERRYNMDVERTLTEKLESIAGAGNVKVMSNVALNLDQVTQKSKDFGGEADKQGVIGQESTKLEKLDKGGENPGGTTGSASNTDDPTYVEGEEGAGDGAYVLDEAERVYSNDEVESLTLKAPGAVNAHNLAVVVDKDIPAATQAALEESVNAWVGKETEKANSVAFSAAELVKPEEAKEALPFFEKNAGLVQYAKWGVLGMGLLLLAFLMRKSLNQRTDELLQPADELLLLEAGSTGPVPLEELEAALQMPQSLDSRKRQELQHRVETIVDNKPAEVAAQLRGWLYEDGMSRSGR